MQLVKYKPVLLSRWYGWAACLGLIAFSGMTWGQQAAPIAPGESRVNMPEAVDAPPPAALPRVQTSVSDVGTGTALRALLASDNSIPAENINVTVAGGVATLRGSVPSLFVRDRAIELAQSMRGIERVENLLAVAGPSRPDAAILQDVTTALASEPTISALRIGVGVHEGEVTLSGTVDRWQTQEQVSQMVKDVPGVRGINTRITFTTSNQPDDQILAQVQRRLDQDAALEPGLVRVSVLDGAVSLSGTVGSVFERNRAITDAWVEGVSAVSANALRVDVTARGEMIRPAEAAMPTDQEIRGALSNALAYSNRLLSFNPEIRVVNGVVTLDGVVDSPEAKREAETIAAGVPGVQRVQNELEVRATDGDGTTTTTALTSPDGTTTETAAIPEGDVAPLVAQFRDAVNKDRELSSYQLSGAVSDDGLRLYGIVDSQAKKERAEQLAAALPGVDKVISKIRVSEDWQVTENGLRPSDSQIRQAIQQALAWNPYIDPSELTITVQNGIVTLEGNVENWRDSNMASRAALLSGAVDVRNNLTVATTATDEARQIATEAAQVGAAPPIQEQNVAVVPGAVPGVEQPASVPEEGMDDAFDSNVDVVTVPGGGYGGLLVPGPVGTQEPGTGLNRDIRNVAPRNVPVDDTANGSMTEAPGATTPNPTPGQSNSVPAPTTPPANTGATASAPSGGATKP